MFFDLGTLPAAIAYKILTATITPRPIAWITTRSAKGICNAAPFSFFNMMGHAPPTVAVGAMRHPKRGFNDTAHNIVETGEFVIHLVPARMAEAMNATSVDAPPDVDELALTGIETVKSRFVAAPRIVESPVALECRTITTVLTGPHQTVIIGQVLCAHIADQHVLDAELGYIDTPALDLVSRMHGKGWYGREATMFQLTRPDPLPDTAA